MIEHDWLWRPNSITFKPNYFTHKNEFGKQSHVFGSPFWSFELTLPPKNNDDRRDIATFFALTEGRDVVNVYDPRVPYPKYYDRFKNECDEITIAGLITDVTVKSTDRATSSLVVSGDIGEYITKDDPIAFTHLGIRHYYRASQNLLLDGTNQTLNVTLRPRVTIAGLNIVTDRDRPTHRFLIDINDVGGLTNSDSLTSFTLKGQEYWGTV